MDEQQATPDSAGEPPHAARTPAAAAAGPDDTGYELPPPPAPGALWATPSGGAPPSAASLGDSAAAPASAHSSAAVPAAARPVSAAPSAARPVSAAPGATAARASVPGTSRIDPAELGGSTGPITYTKVYGGRAGEAPSDAPEGGTHTAERDEDWFVEPAEKQAGQSTAEPRQGDGLRAGVPDAGARVADPEIEPAEPAQPDDPRLPEPSTPDNPPRPAQPPTPGEPVRPVEPERPIEPPPPVEPPPSPFPAPEPPGPFPGPSPEPGPAPQPGPGPAPVPDPPVPGPVPPGPGPSPVPPGPDPSPVPPGPDPSPVPGPPSPSPVPPGPGPSPVPGPPQPVFPPPPMIPASGGLPAYTLPPATGPRPGAPSGFADRPAAGDRPREGDLTEATRPVPGTGARDHSAWSPGTRTSSPAYVPDLPAQATPAPGAHGGRQQGAGVNPFGVAASGADGQPFGGFAAPVSAPHQPITAVPHQRLQGTVYGGLGSDSPIDMTMPVSMNPLENSGSLTGYILAQGWHEPPDAWRRNNTKVVVAMLVVLLTLVGVSLLFLFTAGSAFTDMIHGVLKR
jgi:hypothetical protein